MQHYKIIFMILSMFMIGCTNSPIQREKHYLLPIQLDSHTHTPRPNAVANTPLLILRPIVMADHLNSQGIVYQISEQQIITAQNHLWAQDITTQISNYLINQLRAQIKQFWVIPAHTSELLDLTPKDNKFASLQIKLLTFNGSYKGQAKISGEWSVINEQNILLINQPFMITIDLTSDGYPALVDALAVGLNKLSSDISKQIKYLMPKTNH